MDNVFIYWDNSNIFHGARAAAEQREGQIARYRVRINFKAMLQLAHAGRPVKKALAVGSVPPEMRSLWNRMEAEHIDVELFDRGSVARGEQEVPDRILQLRMLEDGFDNNSHPGIVVLLTGDGAGFYDGAGFHRTMERLHKRGWRVEILSWLDSCNHRMKTWAEENGVFIALDDYYESVTLLEPSSADYPTADPRLSVELDLSRRPTAT